MTFRYAHRSPRHLHHAVKELDDGGSFGGSMSGHARAPRGTHTASRPRNPSNGPTSCLHAPTASQAGRRRFDPGRPLSLRAVTRQGFFVWPPPSRAVAAAISQSRKCPDDADLSIEKYEICEIGAAESCYRFCYRPRGRSGDRRVGAESTEPRWVSASLPQSMASPCRVTVTEAQAEIREPVG